LDRQIVDRLRLDGYDVTYIAEIAPGILDEKVLDHSRRKESVLITADKDFGELAFRQHQSMSGILLVRLAGLKARVKASMVAGPYAITPTKCQAISPFSALAIFDSAASRFQ